MSAAPLRSVWLGLESILALLLAVLVKDLADAVLRLLAALRQPQVHVRDRVVLLHALLQLLATVLSVKTT